MANISCEEAARQLLDCCLSGETWPRGLLIKLLDEGCCRELFGVVVEGLADRFEPTLCDTYAALLSEALALVEPELDREELPARYQRIRKPRKFDGGQAGNVFVLSRVTLGADVAITSVILDAAKQRFPDARIFLVGSRKCWELFEADRRIEHLPIAYPRVGLLRERIEAWRAVRRALLQPGSITIDPDSRLTQLGLLPVCPDEDYFFFESRAFGGDGEESLGNLTKRWVLETFGVEHSSAYIAPKQADAGGSRVTISLGVGENAAKRVADPFEAGLVRALAESGATVLIDKGAGGEEAERVEKAITGLSPARVRCWDGSFAGFAAQIARSDLYIGYDSAGQHVAAACGTPLVSVFTGFVTPRMFARWHPTGPGPMKVLRIDDPEPGRVLEMTLEAAYGIMRL